MNTQHFITPARFVKQNVVERMLPPQEASENCLFIKEDHGTVITSSAVCAVAFPMKMWSAHHFRVGVGNQPFLFIYFIHHTCFQSAKTRHCWVFPLLQCHYKTMFIVCGICSNFTALAPFCTHCLVLRWTGYGIRDSFHAVLFKDVIVGPCTGHSQPLGLFPKR